MDGLLSMIDIVGRYARYNYYFVLFSSDLAL